MKSDLNSNPMDPSRLRMTIAKMVSESGEGHIPSSYSILDILISIYSCIKDLGEEGCQHKFVLSKGHGCAALYVVLASRGILPWEDIKSYGTNGSRLGGHPDRNKQDGVESNSGSLGHGFPFAVGLALANKIRGIDKAKTYVLLGDGECQEGTTWESASIAVNQDLGSLTAIIDWNGSASQLQSKEYLVEKWAAFGWKTIQVDGHDIPQLKSVIGEIHSTLQSQPTAIIAKTVKGRGVSFLEGHGNWHHKIPNQDEIKLIYEELDS